MPMANAGSSPASPSPLVPSHSPGLAPSPADTIEGVAAGVYHAQLEYWFKRFGPKRFLLTSTDAYEEDIFAATKELLAELRMITIL